MRIRLDISEALRGLDARRKIQAVQRGLAVGSALIMSRLQAYPPPPLHSTYRRTGTLGRRWTMRQSGLQVLIGNNTPYAPEVQGNKQRPFHRQTGWQTPEDVVKRSGGEIEQMIVAYLERS